MGCPLGVVLCCLLFAYVPIHVINGFLCCGMAGDKIVLE